MGYYHNKLDKKYFKNSVYMKRFYDTFDITSKEKKQLQYDIIYNTYNTFVMVNNYFFTSNYTMKHSDRINKSIEVINDYLTTYKNKIKKCYDKQCIDMYNDLEILEGKLETLKEDYKKEKAKDTSITYPKLSLYKEITKEIDDYMTLLIMVDFDKLVDSKDMPFIKAPNDKLPRKINCKLIDDLSIKVNTSFDEEKQERLNNEFIDQYYRDTDIDLNKDKEQRDFIFMLHNIIKDLNNAIVDYYTTKDITIIFLFVNFLPKFFEKDIEFVKDIRYKALFKRVKAIYDDLCKKHIDIAYDKLKDIISDYKDIYEYMS